MSLPSLWQNVQDKQFSGGRIYFGYDFRGFSPELAGSIALISGRAEPSWQKGAAGELTSWQPGGREGKRKGGEELGTSYPFQDTFSVTCFLWLEPTSETLHHFPTGLLNVDPSVRYSMARSEPSWSICPCSIPTSGHRCAGPRTLNTQAPGEALEPNHNTSNTGRDRAIMTQVLLQEAAGGFLLQKTLGMSVSHTWSETHWLSRQCTHERPSTPSDTPKPLTVFSVRENVCTWNLWTKVNPLLFNLRPTGVTNLGHWVTKKKISLA